MKLVFTLAARRDIAEAVAFISHDNPAAASRQKSLVQEAARRLLDFPGLGASESGSSRRLQVSGTSFQLIYAQQHDTIVILRVWHGARQWPPARD